MPRERQPCSAGVHASGTPARPKPTDPAPPLPDPPTLPRAAATGKTQPPAAEVQKLTSLICSDPEKAGDQIRNAVQAGSSQAQVAVYAIFSADCPDEEAASTAYGECGGSGGGVAAGSAACSACCIMYVATKPSLSFAPAPCSAGAAIDVVNTGDPANVDAVGRWALGSERLMHAMDSIAEVRYIVARVLSSVL